MDTVNEHPPTSATGIIAEYNPFHNGHALQIKMLREQYPDTGIIALMSGSLTQRGEIAVLDKWTRASLAVQGGCDLVIELPAIYVLRSAQDFARGGVGLLARLTGAKASLAFGAELPDEEALSLAAAAMEDDATQCSIRQMIREGRSYAEAVCHVLSARTGVSESILRQPNTILAIEYMRAIRALPAASSIRPIPLPRLGAKHDDREFSPGTATLPGASDTASAGAIRCALDRERPDWDTISGFVPSFVLAKLKQAHERGLPDENLLLRPLLLRLLTADLPHIRSIYGIREGIEHRILNAARSARSLDELAHAVSSRRYPKSHVRRLLLALMLDLSKDLIASMDAAGPCLARVLAMGDRGRCLLRRMKKEAALPVITKVGSFWRGHRITEGLGELSPAQRQLSYDILATELRNLALPAPLPLAGDFTTSPVYVKQQ